MGHYCRVCGRDRPNEKFSGKGHRSHICKDCSKYPKTELDIIFIRQEMQDFINRQSNISNKNITRLKTLMQSENKQIRELSGIVLEVARIAPRRKGRFKVLARSDLELLKRLKNSELADGEDWEEELIEEEL